MIYDNSYISDDALYHHGIAGQKWGKRNGPPYPLGAEDRSAQEKRAAKSGSVSKVQKKTQKNNGGVDKQGLSDSQKKALKIGVGIAGTALAAYGGYKLTQYVKNNTDLLNAKKVVDSKVIDIGSIPVNKAPINTQSIDTMATNNTVPFDNEVPNIGGIITKSSHYGGLDKETGFIRMKKPETLQEAKQKINHLWMHSVEAYNKNCGQCALAFTARRRGLDVEAMPNPSGTTFSQFMSNFKSAPESNISRVRIGRKDINTMNFMDRANIVRSKVEKSISKYPDGSDGVVAMPFENEGHFFNWIKENGKVTFVDSQSNVDIVGSFGMYHEEKERPLRVVRTDNLHFNKEQIKNNVRGYGSMRTTDINREDLPGDGFVIKKHNPRVRGYNT